jgi:hypothetical protein
LRLAGRLLLLLLLLDSLLLLTGRGCGCSGSRLFDEIGRLFGLSGSFRSGRHVLLSVENFLHRVGDAVE